jgi:hypothetical protein
MTFRSADWERGVTDSAIAPTGGMEGGGAYNQHAAPQAAGAAIALQLLREAARTVAPPSGNEPIVIVDYGSSQGFNSIAPVRAAIESLRGRVGAEKPILVCHEDLPLNDFNALFSVLDRDPQSYLRDAPNVFACAIARSFYERVAPDNFVCLGWSSFSAMWLSRIPTTIRGHFFPARATGETRDAFERQAAEDWVRFLSLRASELRPGGKMVIAVLGTEEDPDPRDWNFLDEANETLTQMVDDGFLEPAERVRMVHGAVPRRKSDLLAPFSRDGRFIGLEVDSCGIAPIPDTAWADYKRDGNALALAAKHAAYVRVTFGPTLAGGLVGDSGPARRQAFLERLEAGVKRGLADRPCPLRRRVATIVVAKGASLTASERAG